TSTRSSAGASASARSSARASSCASRACGSRASTTSSGCCAGSSIAAACAPTCSPTARSRSATPSAEMTHPVLAALRERPPGARVALVIEGGGMRGAVSGGMALALDELGLAQAFDAAYGSSAGTLNAMWLVSGRVRDGIPTWIDPELVGALIDKRRMLRGGSVVDVRTLVEDRYEQ